MLHACGGNSAFGGACGSWWQDPLAGTDGAGVFGLQKLSPWALLGVKLLSSPFRLISSCPNHLPKKSAPNAQVLMKTVGAGQVALFFQVPSYPAFWDSLAGALAVRNRDLPCCFVLCCCSASLVQIPYHMSVLDIISLLPHTKENKVFYFPGVVFPCSSSCGGFGCFFFFFGLYCWNIYFLSCFYFEKGKRACIPLRCY